MVSNKLVFVPLSINVFAATNGSDILHKTRISGDSMPLPLPLLLLLIADVDVACSMFKIVCIIVVLGVVVVIVVVLPLFCPLKDIFF